MPIIPASEMVGRRFGRLVALEDVGRSPHGKRLWRCQCDCGREAVIVAGALRSGNSQSCGCGVIDATISRNRKHGKSGTLEHRIWKGLHTRCSNPNHASYRNYGARGIRVCERWQSFENFLADMGEIPSQKHSLERIDNDGPYSPQNCRWATHVEQARNSRHNVRVQYQGRWLCISELAELTGKPYELIRERIKRGWDVERAVSQPARRAT